MLLGEDGDERERYNTASTIWFEIDRTIREWSYFFFPPMYSIDASVLTRSSSLLAITATFSRSQKHESKNASQLSKMLAQDCFRTKR